MLLADLEIGGNRRPEASVSVVGDEDEDAWRDTDGADSTWSTCVNELLRELTSDDDGDSGERNSSEGALPARGDEATLCDSDGFVGLEQASAWPNAPTEAKSEPGCSVPESMENDDEAGSTDADRGATCEREATGDGSNGTTILYSTVTFALNGNLSVMTRNSEGAVADADDASWS